MQRGICKMQKAIDVVERLKAVFGVNSYSELAEKVGTSKSTIGGWVHRDTVPYSECVRVALELNVSLDWLLLGRGEQHVPPAPQAGGQDVSNVLGSQPDLPASMGEQLRALARYSNLESQWNILQALENGARSAESIGAKTGMDTDMVLGGLLLAERQGVVRRERELWTLKEGAELQSGAIPDIAAHALRMAQLLLGMVPRTEVNKAALLTAEVCMPVNQAKHLLEALKKTLVQFDQGDQERVTVVIGIG